VRVAGEDVVGERPARLLEDPSAAPRGLTRRALGLHDEHKNGRRFAPHSLIRANHGPLASITAIERQSMPIKDIQTPLPYGDNGNRVMDAHQTRPPIGNGAIGNPATEADQARPPIANGVNGKRQRRPIRPDSH
jgi:hypothetical protein